MKTILVATDFSPAALNAANYAASMALAINAGIVLLHVYQIPVSYSEVAVAVNEEDMTENVEKAMSELKEELIRKSDGKLNVETEVRMGIFSYGLQLACDNVQPYAVIMGSQGTSPAERLIFGSHTVLAVQYLKCPLITVPVGVAFKTIKKIGLACDFDKVLDTVPVREIKMLVNDLNAELHVLNSGKKEVFNPNIVLGPGLLTEVLAPLKPQCHFITNENTDEAIMDFAEKNEIDLLVVLPKRHNMLDKLIHKSHTRQLVLHSHVPVMAIHN
ncbi:MAG: universal stress protein [Ferruginibacter sp.]|nr:universal stress protein [Ferruginibacter sp.]